MVTIYLSEVALSVFLGFGSGSGLRGFRHGLALHKKEEVCNTVLT